MIRQGGGCMQVREQALREGGRKLAGCVCPEGPINGLSLFPLIVSSPKISSEDPERAHLTRSV